MGAIAEMFRTGGIWMYLIFAMSIGGGVIWVLAFALAALKKRSPVALWLLVPVGAILLGALGTAIGVAEAIAALEVATPQVRGRMAMRGASLAQVTLMFGALVAAAYASFGALGVGAGALFGASPEREWRAGHAGIGALLWMVGLGTLVGLWLIESSGLGMILIVEMVMCGLGATLAALADSADEDAAARVARARGAVVLLSIVAPCVGAWGLPPWPGTRPSKPSKRPPPRCA